MKKLPILLFIISIAIFCSSCQPTLIAEFEDRPVVSCYLDAGDTPILNITKLIAFRDDATYSNQDIDDLTITITDNTENVKYVLSNINDGNYENKSLIVQTGHTYSLYFIYNGYTITATTTIPDAPEEVEFSSASIGISIPKQLTSRNMPGIGIEVTWNNDEGDYYIVEGSTTSIQPIQYTYDEDKWPDKSFKLDYTKGNSATLSSQQFQYYGGYVVSVIRILPEYVVMSQGSSSTSTSLVDIRGNIDGGYGIFTGINRFKKNINVFKSTM